MEDLEAHPVVGKAIDLFSRVVGDAAGEVLETYFRERAGAWFERVTPSPADDIVPSDLLSLNLLDVRLPAGLIRDLLFPSDLRQAALPLLERVKDVNIWDDAASEHLATADQLWWLIDQHTAVCLGNSPGVGDSLLSKLLARKRPSLIPITDNVVKSHIQGAIGMSQLPNLWRLFRTALRANAGLQARLTDLAERLEVGDPTLASVKPLRVLDILLWMRHRPHTPA